jgi:hypothetical protein
MKTFYAENFICCECLFEGEPEYSYENLWNKEGCEEIIRICPSCGRTSIVGERCDGEEFFY